MFATQVLPDPFIEYTPKIENSIVVGFLTLDDKQYKIFKGENKIGRDPSICSVVLEHFTISKLHAIIESEGTDDTFIYDVGSTNRSKLGKKFLKPHYRYKIENKSIITLGDVVVEFVVMLDDKSSSQIFWETNSLSSGGKIENLNKKSVIDIFDVSTQVETSEPHNLTAANKLFSSKTSSIPDILPLMIRKESPNPALYFCNNKNQSWSSKEKSLSAEQSFYGLEDSNIFSVDTQCQLSPYPYSNKRVETYNKDIIENNNFNEDDKIKSFLNDGQDDILFDFMSRHSPERPNKIKSLQIKNCKSEMNSENISEQENCATESQKILENHEKTIDKKMTEGILSNDKNLIKDPLVLNNKYQQEVKLENEINCKLYHCENRPTNIFRIETEGLNAKSPKYLDLQKKFCSQTALLTMKGINITQAKAKSDSENSDNSFLEITLDDAEIKNDEDFIMTQQFTNMAEKLISKSLSPDSKISEIKRPSQSKKISVAKNLNNIIKKENFDSKLQNENQKSASFVIEESSDDETDSFIDLSNENLTQRSKNDDVDNTQEFRKKEKDSDPFNEEEDFIFTQKLNSPECHQNKKSDTHENFKLLNFSPRNSEDLISTQLFSSEEFKHKKLQNESEISKINLSNDTETKKKLSEPCVIESSGDETESDLEIMNDKDTKIGFKLSSSSIKTERCKEEINPEKVSVVNENENLFFEENEFSNHSYIFHLEQPPEGDMNHESQSKQLTFGEPKIFHMSSSDKAVETNNSFKSAEKEFEANISDNKITCKVAIRRKENNNGVDCDKSFKHEELENLNSESYNYLNRHSFKVTHMQDIETTGQEMFHPLVNKCILQKIDEGKNKSFPIPFKIQKPEVEVKKSIFSEKKSTSTKLSENKDFENICPKRIRNEIPSEIIPNKKLKTSFDWKFNEQQGTDNLTEKKISKLWKIHDFAQIQTSRTRKSDGISNKDNTLENNNFVTPQTSCRESKKESFKNKISDITLDFAKAKAKNNIKNEKKKLEIFPSQDIPTEPNFFENKITRILRSAKRNSDSSLPSSSSDFLLKSSFGNKTLDNRFTRPGRSKSGSYFGRRTVKIAFTGFECDSLQKIITDLGGKKANDINSADVLVTDRVRRTVKFLCAISLSIPITSPSWILSCKEEGKFLNPWNFILKNEFGDIFNFDLKVSLERSKKKKLLKGYNVFATENTKPPPKDLLKIVECCGGSPVYKFPDIWPKRTIFVSCFEDKNLWPLQNSRYVKLVHYEFILSGVLKQQIDFTSYKLR